MRTVCYLMSHPAHLPYLAVSLLTLRRHWKGPVVVFAWRESWEIVERMVRDPRLDFLPVKREPAYRGKNDQFLDKIKAVEDGEQFGDVLLYLDADTSVHGRIEPILDAAEVAGFAATQWNDWFTSSGLARGRIESLREFPNIDPDLITMAVQDKLPSVNGGVWAARPESPVLPFWHENTCHAKSTFIADEKVLHLAVARYAKSGNLKVMAGGRWNCSPKFQPKNLRDEDVVIRHYHGDSCVRPDKSQKGYDIWWPMFQEALDANIGGINAWIDGVGNRWLDKLKAGTPEEITVSEVDRETAASICDPGDM